MMDKTKYEAGLSIIGSAGSLLALAPISEMLEYLEHAEAIGPFLDPTLYRDYLNSRSAQSVKPLMEAAAAFKTQVELARQAAQL